MDTAIAWVLMAASIVGLAVTFPLWLRNKVDDRAMIGLTLVLSWIALTYAAFSALVAAK